jgi:hypothetical protein
MLTYDRRILRTDLAQWQRDIAALYDASAKRSNASTPTFEPDVVVTGGAQPWDGSGLYSTYVWQPAAPAQTTYGGRG